MTKFNAGRIKTFFSFFNMWFALGVLIILIACIFSLVFQPQVITEQTTTQDIFLNFIYDLIPAILQTIGIAFMLGSIFDFSKNSQGFIEFVSDILSNIIIGRTFLSKLEESGKRDALTLILRPTESQIAQYSRIDDYFEKRITDSMKMWDTNFKTNTVINIRVKMNDDGSAVETVGTLTYRIYKVKDQYANIQTTFERKNSKVSDTKILYPGGVYPITNPDPEMSNSAGIEYTNYSFRVPEELYKYPYLTIERKIFEPGFDHWTNFHWTSLTPYDGLVFNLSCSDGLVIKEHIIFDEKQLYNVTFNEEKTEMHIISTDWLEANTGFSLTISCPHRQEMQNM